jgi:serine/threonine protein kinase
VAVKVLPPSLADDAARRRRFEREAQIIAALNHPNIVTISSIEQWDGRLFLTMELVEGQPLSQLIPSRGLPVDRLLKIAILVADALSAAHQQDIVHRDLKPDNIMVGEDARVKVLDFGIARLKEVASGDAVTASQTLPLTREGEIIGTVGYISPEQADGRTIDARSDLFSLGVVLYQMATGERPFKGDTPLSTLSSIVKDPAPAITALNPTLPRELARIVRRCLVKDPARRYQTAADVRNDLSELEQDLASDSSAPVVQQPDRRRWREMIAWMLAAALLVTTIIAFLRQPADPSVDMLSMLPPDGTMLTEGEAPQVSPDGRKLVFVATDASGRTLPSILHVRPPAMKSSSRPRAPVRRIPTGSVVQSPRERQS